MSFFENYKRPIYIAVAIFALVIFSITGVMLSFFGELARPKSSAESIALPSGERSALTEEDLNVGLLLGRMHRTVSSPGGIDFPGFVFSTVQKVENPRETFGILRRVALDRGIDVADEDVRRCIDFACRQKEAMQPGQPAPPRLTEVRLARIFGAGSVVELEEMIRESLRVSALVRSEMQAIDLSEAALADYVKKQRKRRTVSYVACEGKEYRKELEKLKPTDEDLKAWIADLDEASRLPYFNSEVVSFATAGLLYDQIDPAEWKDVLDGVEIKDTDIEARYNADKELLYKIEEPKKDGDKKDGDKKDGDKKDGDKKDGDKKDGGLLAQDPKPKSDEKTDPKDAKQGGGENAGPTPPAPKQDDGEKKSQGPIGPVPADQVGYRRIAEVKDEIKRKLEVEAIIKSLSQKADAARQSAIDKVRAAEEAKKKKDAEKNGAGKTGDGKQDAGKKGDGEKPKDDKKAPDPKKSGDNKNGGLTQLQIPGAGPQLGPQGPENPEAAAAAAKAEAERIAKQRADAALFDFKKWYEANMAGKKGVIWIGPKKELFPPDKFQDFPPFGKWGSSWSLGALQDFGAISNLQTAKKGAFFFRIVDRERNKMKSMDEVREDATENYFATESSKKAKKVAEDFRKLVRTKAEEMLKDEVAKLRDAVPGKVTEKLSAWRKKLDEQVASVKAKLEAKSLPQAAIPILQKQLEDAQGKLALEKEEKERIQKSQDDELEKALVKLVAPKLAAAFDVAAKDAKMEAKVLGPFFDDESGQQRFRLLDDGPKKFLKSEQALKSAEKGAVPDPVEDPKTQTWYVVRIDIVDEGDDSALTRKAIEDARTRFISDRVSNLLMHSFDLRAIKKRYAWKTTKKAEDDGTGGDGSAEDKGD